MSCTASVTALIPSMSMSALPVAQRQAPLALGPPALAPAPARRLAGDGDARRAAMSDERLEECLDRWEELRQQGKDLDAAELCSDCPELVEEVQRHLAALRSLAWLEDDTASIVDEPPCCVDAVALQPGSEPIPGYRLVRLLGRGGFGSVWRATGPGGFDVALKFVPLGEGAGNVELRALEAVRSVRHPNLLALFGAWQAGGLLVVAA